MLPTTELRMVWVGRLEVQKAFDLAIAAFARLRPSRPALRLVIAGDGPARPALERQAGARGNPGESSRTTGCPGPR